jgi:hypothetical protein
MKKNIKKSFVLSFFVVGLFSLLVGQLQAQTFKTLHSFSGTDGRRPNGHLVLSGNTLYGTDFVSVGFEGQAIRMRSSTTSKYQRARNAKEDKRSKLGGRGC